MTESTPKPPAKRRTSKPRTKPAPKADDLKIEAPQDKLVEVVPAPSKPEPKPEPKCEIKPAAGPSGRTQVRNRAPKPTGAGRQTTRRIRTR